MVYTEQKSGHFSGIFGQRINLKRQGEVCHCQSALFHVKSQTRLPLCCSSVAGPPLLHRVDPKIRNLFISLSKPYVNTPESVFKLYSGYFDIEKTSALPPAAAVRQHPVLLAGRLALFHLVM